MKKLHLLLVFVATMTAASATWAQAQHEGHQMSGAAVTAPPNARCAEAGRKTLALMSAIEPRSGSEGTARDAQREVAELQRAVSAAQAELFTCRAAVPADVVTPPAGPMAGMDHSKMNMGTPAADAKPAASGAKPAAPMAGMDHSKMNMGTPAAGVKPAASGAKPAGPMAGMDHSKMNMGTPAAGAKPAASAAKPAAPMAGMDHSKMNIGTPAAGAKPAKPGTKPAVEPKPHPAAAPMAGMDHSKMGAPATPAAAAPTVTGGAGKLPVMMAERIADPACPDTVGQATAPKAVFARRVYYFCSVAARDEFRKDPAAYLQKHPR